MGSNSEYNAVHQMSLTAGIADVRRMIRGRSVLITAILLGSTAGMILGILPAYAEALKDWGYDVQTRSLNITLPPTVTPTVSIVAPNQLLLALPNTQVGNVLSQTVEDGLVESIVLEQATPETVWVTVEFAAGTVLSDTQYVRPLTTNENGDQQWQVRPALVSASRSASSQAIASAPSTATDSSASSLRMETDAIAQLPDFADLPLLDPAMPIDQPVSVPPLNSPTAPAAMSPAAVPTVSVPPLEAPDAPTAGAEPFSPDETAEQPADLSPVFEVEVISTEPPVASPSVASPSVASPSVASEPPSEPLSEAPPFLGDLDNAAADIQPEAEDPEQIASGTAPVTPAAVVPAREPVAHQSVINTVQPSTVSRWPEPIPFGQPLPD